MGNTSEKHNGLEFLDVNISQMESWWHFLQDSNATITSATLTDNISNGILIDGGEVEILDATITGTVPANAGAPEDGNAVKTDGNANVTIQGANFDNNLYSSIYIASGDVTVENATLQNSLLASIFTDPNNSNVSLMNVDLVDTLNYGMVHQSEGDLYWKMSISLWIHYSLQVQIMKSGQMQGLIRNGCLFHIRKHHLK